MSVKSTGRRKVIILFFFFAQTIALTILGVGSSVAYANVPPDETSIVTPTDTVTSTPLAKLYGRVDLQGRPTPQPDESWEIPLDVSLSLPGASTPKYTFATSTDANGEFLVEDIEPGAYDIRVKGFNTLSNLVRGVNFEPGENSQFFGQLKSGDVELDLSFNRLVYDHDFNAFLTAQDKCEGDPGYDSIFDLYVDNCINVGDAGILLGNAPDWPDTPTEGDIDVTDVVGTTSFLTTTAGDSALLSFNPSEKEVEVGEDTTVLLDVAPCCNSAMNAVDFTLSFSPTLIQVNDVLIGQLPLVVNKTVDNSQGTVRFMVGIPGSVTETVTVAHLSFKAISNTSGAIITPTHFAVAGPSGLFSTTTTQSMTVKTKSSGSCGGGYCLYFPVIFKDSSPP